MLAKNNNALDYSMHYKEKKYLLTNTKKDDKED